MSDMLVGVEMLVCGMTLSLLMCMRLGTIATRHTMETSVGHISINLQKNDHT